MKLIITYGWSREGFLIDCKIPTANKHYRKKYIQQLSAWLTITTHLYHNAVGRKYSIFLWLQCFHQWLFCYQSFHELCTKTKLTWQLGFGAKEINFCAISDLWMYISSRSQNGFWNIHPKSVVFPKGETT